LLGEPIITRVMDESGRLSLLNQSLQLSFIVLGPDANKEGRV
jgi:hypothetical protein